MRHPQGHCHLQLKDSEVGRLGGFSAGFLEEESAGCRLRVIHREESGPERASAKLGFVGLRKPDSREWQLCEG